jgi:hypothetical protein
VPVLSAMAFPSTPSPSSTATVARACRRAGPCSTTSATRDGATRRSGRIRCPRCRRRSSSGPCPSARRGASGVATRFTRDTVPSLPARSHAELPMDRGCHDDHVHQAIIGRPARLGDAGPAGGPERSAGLPAAHGRPPDLSGRAVPVRRTQLAGIDIRRNRMGQGPPGDRRGPAAPRPAHRDVHSCRSRRRAEYGRGGADAPADQYESARAPALRAAHGHPVFRIEPIYDHDD